MNIQEFAERFRLKVTRDECGDPIIAGRHGHLYEDDGLCMMLIDTRPIVRLRLDRFGARKVWQGDISLSSNGTRVQDVWVKGIPETGEAAAIQIAGCKAKRIISPDRVEALRRYLAKTPTHGLTAQRQTLEPFGGDGVMFDISRR